MDFPTPMQLQSHAEGTRAASSTDVLIDTADQVTQQLSIVQKLFQQNTRYLESSEKAWIDHILKSSSLLINELGHFTEPGAKVAGERPQWTPNSAFFHQMKRLLTESSTGRDDLTLLLVAAQSLNSAIGLLSCCRDRWDWYQSTKQAHGQISPDPSLDELSQLINRRRRTKTLESNGLVRLASLHLHRGRPSTGEQESRDKMVEVPADNWSSILSQNARGGMKDLERSSRLSLAIVETVEKWRQNAEYALSRASSIGLAEEFDTDRSEGSMSEDIGEASSTSHHIRGRTASFGSDPIPLNSETSPIMITQMSKFPQANRGGTYHHPSIDHHHQNSVTAMPPTYHTSRRKPLSSRNNATYTLSTRTSASTSTDTSGGSTSTTNSTSTKSSTSPQLLRPASISLRNSWEKESVIPDTDEPVDIAERSGPRTSLSQPTIPEIPVLTPRLSPHPRNSLHRPEGVTSSSVSSWSSQTTLLAPYTHSSSGSVDTAFSPPSEYRVSRGRAWLERQAANQV